MDNETALLIIPINRECLFRDSLFNRDRLPAWITMLPGTELSNQRLSSNHFAGTFQIYDLCNKSCVRTMVYLDGNVSSFSMKKVEQGKCY